MNDALRRKLLSLCVAIGGILIVMVVLTAHAAEVKHDNNIIAKQNAALQGEIDTLNIKIKSANSIDHIESIAGNQLGMVYPNKGQCVYLSDQKAPGGDLALTIKGNAYN